MIDRLINGIYNNFKKNSNEEEFYNTTKKILESNGVDYEMTKKGVGRTYSIDSYVIKVDSKEYVFPLVKIDDEKKKNSLFYKCAEKGKLIPRAIPRNLVENFYKTIEYNDEKSYLKLLKKEYSDDYIVSLFTDTMSYKQNFKPFLILIENSIKSFFNKDYISAIAVLLPCIEGVIRKINAKNLNEDGVNREDDFRRIGLEQSIDKWKKITFPSDKYWFPPELVRNNNIYYYLDEVFEIIDSYYLFLKNFLYMNSEEFADKYPNETLNRHEILHGYSNVYGTEENWYKLFNILNFLLFVDSEFNFTKPLKSISSLKSHLMYLSFTNDKLTPEIKEFDLKFDEDILLILKKSVEKALAKVDIPKSIPETSIENYFRFLVKENLDLSSLKGIAYYIKEDTSRGVIKVSYGSKDIFMKENQKDLLIISIDNEKITKEEMNNVHYIIDINSKEKVIANIQKINSI